MGLSVWSAPKSWESAPVQHHVARVLLYLRCSVFLFRYFLLSLSSQVATSWLSRKMWRNCRCSKFDELTLIINVSSI